MAAPVGLTVVLVAQGFGWPGLRFAWVLVVTIAAALWIDRGVGRWMREVREAEGAALRMRRLYELTRRTLDMDLHVEPGAQLAQLVCEIFELEGAAVFDADLHEVYEAGSWTTSPRELAQNVYHFESSDDDAGTGISRRVVRLGAVPVGSLVLRGETSPLVNSAIAALIAVTFDRYRATANESRIEAERQAEQMRATVLDNLAHAYKTPLTAIRAASTGLAEMGPLSPAQAELVALIDQQAQLLSELTGKLLITARMEAGAGEDGSAPFALHTALENVASLIDEVVASLSDGCSVRIEIDVADQGLAVSCDGRLVGMLLTQYLDNACKYADADSTVTVRAAQSGDEVLFSVHSFGPVIPMTDRERIFDRYYRASNASRYASGTGIGLSIAKRVALAHGGAVWVSSEESQGTTFFAAIPAACEAPVSEKQRSRARRHDLETTEFNDGSPADPDRAAELERSAQ